VCPGGTVVEHSTLRSRVPIRERESDGKKGFVTLSVDGDGSEFLMKIFFRMKG
jgi:hypothetical protein